MLTLTPTKELEVLGGLDAVWIPPGGGVRINSSHGRGQPP